MGIYYERNKDVPFNAHLWKLGNSVQTRGFAIEPYRHQMVADLLKKHRLYMKHRNEIVALLGEEGEMENGGDTLRYWLNESYFCITCVDPTSIDYLVIDFRSSGYPEKIYVSTLRPN